MKTSIRNIGNSKGVIIPNNLIKKYHFKKKVIFIETDAGLIIKPTQEKSLFEQKLVYVKANKDKIYRKMKQEAQNNEIIAYYEQQTDDYGNIDLEILDL